MVASLAAAGYAAIAVFQVALALGAPSGGLAWGGAGDGRLEPGLRVASGVAALVLPWMALVVLARGGVLRTSPVRPAHLGGYAWAIAGLMALNTLGDLGPF